MRFEKRSAEYELVRHPTWSPDGRSVAFAARKDGQWRLVVGEHTSDPCDEIDAITWEPSSERVHFGCRKGRNLLWSELATR